jgi:hypothetical protein
MGHFTRAADFDHEPVEGRPIALELLGKELQGHGLSERQVVGAVHLAHTAGTEPAHDAIAVVEAVTGREAAVMEAVGLGAGWNRARFRRPNGRCRRRLLGLIDRGAATRAEAGAGWQLGGARSASHRSVRPAARRGCLVATAQRINTWGTGRILHPNR